ncbi:TPA: hypothetical protein ACUUEQ_003403 [Pseudomonas aeruginosa]
MMRCTPSPAALTVLMAVVALAIIMCWAAQRIETSGLFNSSRLAILDALHTLLRNLGASR